MCYPLDLEVSDTSSFTDCYNLFSQKFSISQYSYEFQRENPNGYWLICRKFWSCCTEMEKEAKSHRANNNNNNNNGNNNNNNRATETDFGLQWGNRKRLRCVKVKDQSLANKSDCLGKKKITSRVDRRVVSAAEKESVSPQPHRINK